MSQSGGSPVVPVNFLSQLYSVFPDFAEKKEDSMVPMQQDAEECFSRLLTTLDSKLGDSQADESIIKRLFALKMSVQYRCEEAENETSESMELTFKLPCHIGKDTSFLLTGLSQSLDEHITKFSQTLNREAVFVKKQRILRLPKHIVVQFVRFYWKPGVGKKEGNRAKVVKPIQFPETLDLFDLCHDSLKEKLKISRQIIEQREEERLGLASDESAMKLEKPHFAEDENDTGKYRLSALITHEGYSAEGGHYVAWARSTEGKQTDWYLFDDDKVSKQSFETVTALSRSTGDAPIPYLLVYSTVPSADGANLSSSQQE
jgi:ubiquitin carboxyl-terminal hydrolase 14